MTGLGWLTAAVALALWTLGVVSVTQAEIRRRTVRAREIARRVALVGPVRASSPPSPQAGALIIRPLPERYTRRPAHRLPLNYS